MEYATTDKFRLDSETVESLATAKGGWTALAFKFIVGENENWPPKKSGWKVRYLGEWRSRREYIELLGHLADRDENSMTKMSPKNKGKSMAKPQ